jgi:RimJ/RimL family protein N-acetyltransferase
MGTNHILRTVSKYLKDTPDNEPIYFAAEKRQGRFWLDDPKSPRALVAVTGGKAPVTFLRQLDEEAEIDWQSIVKEVDPEGSLAGDPSLLEPIWRKLGYAAPSIEVVFAQKGFLRLKEEIATIINRYDESAFRHVNANAPWLWDPYGRVQAALDDFPASAILHDDKIIAIAMVGSHSMKWANIGYWVHPEHRFKEYATRCAAALTGYLNQRRISVAATTDETHLGSLAVMRKIGLHEYCRYARAYRQRGQVSGARGQ